MNDSILNTIKQMLGYEPGVEIPASFQTEIIMYINGAFSFLTQLGLGSPSGFSIQDESSLWSDIIPPDMNLEDVKLYVYLKTKIKHDPPQSSTALETMKEEIKECEARIMYEVDEGR